MPIQAPQWTDYLNCSVCFREFGAPPRCPISLGCGHTICRQCIRHLHARVCPFDQAAIVGEPDEMGVNTALLQLVGFAPPAHPYHPPAIEVLPDHEKKAYDVVVRCMEHLTIYLKYCATSSANAMTVRLSRPMQRKLVMLLQCSLIDEEGRGRAARGARSLGERSVTELILQHQNSQQLSANLWAAVRARGCQFLGPAMQEEVLKLVLLALEDGSALSRKVLVLFVVQRLEPHFPQASKTSIGHVVQLLYRASCFKVSKRECDSSLMQLKEEFRTYETLRREHDAQIVQIATEAGLRIAPDQWSALLYGDTAHKSHMQSIIDKLQGPQSFAQSIQELFLALQRHGDPGQLVSLSIHLDRLAVIDPSPDAISPSMLELAEIMGALEQVMGGLSRLLQLGRDLTAPCHKYSQERLDNNTNEACPAVGGTPTHARQSGRCYCPRGACATNNDAPERHRIMNANSLNNGNAVNNGTYPPPVSGAHPPPGMQPVQPPPVYQSFHVQRPMGPQPDNYMMPGVPPMQIQMPADMIHHDAANMNGMQPTYPQIMQNQGQLMLNPERGFFAPPFIPGEQYQLHASNATPWNNLQMSQPIPMPIYQGPSPTPNHTPDQTSTPFNSMGYVNQRHEDQMAKMFLAPQEMPNISPYIFESSATFDEVEFLSFQPRTENTNQDRWTNVNDLYDFSSMRNSLLVSSASEDLELEEELQALERRIDTEFKNTD